MLRRRSNPAKVPSSDLLGQQSVLLVLSAYARSSDDVTAFEGYKRIDVPRRGVQTSGAGALHVAEVRFNCISKVIGAEGDDVQVYLKRFSLHKRVVPWE